MERIDFELTAKNISGVQTLELVKNGDDFWFVLAGEYNGEKIQIEDVKR